MCNCAQSSSRLRFLCAFHSAACARMWLAQRSSPLGAFLGLSFSFSLGFEAAEVVAASISRDGFGAPSGATLASEVVGASILVVGFSFSLSLSFGFGAAELLVGASVSKAAFWVPSGAALALSLRPFFPLRPGFAFVFAVAVAVVFCKRDPFQTRAILLQHAKSIKNVVNKT
jgi:hypothetical protein